VNHIYSARAELEECCPSAAPDSPAPPIDYGAPAEGLRFSCTDRSTGTPDAYLALRDGAMHSLGIGTTRNIRSVVSGIILPSLRSPQYTLRNKVKMWRGKFAYGVSALWNEMLATNLAENLTELALPIYFLHGVYDYTCSYTLAKSYFKQLKAPLKVLYTFERSAHSPIFEEPEKARRILRDDVLAGVNNLADQGPGGGGMC
jgi:pimeloyl-ACP methyl ester carboxylesterase